MHICGNKNLLKLVKTRSTSNTIIWLGVTARYKSMQYNSMLLTVATDDDTSKFGDTNPFGPQILSLEFLAAEKFAVAPSLFEHKTRISPNFPVGMLTS